MKQKMIALLAACALFSACVEPPHPCDTNAAYQDGMRALAQADAEIAAQAYGKANATLNVAINKFGMHYADGIVPQPNDDTGTHLMVAREAERKGNLAVAAGRRRGVLESRLNTFEFAKCKSHA